MSLVLAEMVGTVQSYLLQLSCSLVARGRQCDPGTKTVPRVMSGRLWNDIIIFVNSYQIPLGVIMLHIALKGRSILYKLLIIVAKSKVSF